MGAGGASYAYEDFDPDQDFYESMKLLEEMEREGDGTTKPAGDHVEVETPSTTAEPYVPRHAKERPELHFTQEQWDNIHLAQDTTCVENRYFWTRCQSGKSWKNPHYMARGIWSHFLDCSEEAKEDWFTKMDCDERDAWEAEVDPIFRFQLEYVTRDFLFRANPDNCDRPPFAGPKPQCADERQLTLEQWEELHREDEELCRKNQRNWMSCQGCAERVGPYIRALRWAGLGFTCPENCHLTPFSSPTRPVCQKDRDLLAEFREFVKKPIEERTCEQHRSFWEACNERTYGFQHESAKQWRFPSDAERPRECDQIPFKGGRVKCEDEDPRELRSGVCQVASCQDVVCPDHHTDLGGRCAGFDGFPYELRANGQYYRENVGPFFSAFGPQRCPEVGPCPKLGYVTGKIDRWESCTPVSDEEHYVEECDAGREAQQWKWDSWPKTPPTF